MEPCVHFVVAKLFQVFFVMKGSNQNENKNESKSIEVEGIL